MTTGRITIETRLLVNSELVKMVKDACTSFKYLIMRRYPIDERERASRMVHRSSSVRAGPSEGEYVVTKRGIVSATDKYESYPRA